MPLFDLTCSMCGAVATLVTRDNVLSITEIAGWEMHDTHWFCALCASDRLIPALRADDV